MGQKLDTSRAPRQAANNNSHRRWWKVIHPSIHPSSTAYPESGRGVSRRSSSRAEESSSPTEAKKVKKNVRWCWKKTKRAPPTQDVAEKPYFPSSRAEESVILVEDPTQTPLLNKLTTFGVTVSTQTEVLHSNSPKVEDSETARKRELACLGLPNLEDTCYMNSVLQALLTLTPFVDEIHSQRRVWASQPQSELFGLFEIVEECRRSNGRRQKKLALTMFLNSVARSNPEFTCDEQEDAHEFLSTVLNEMKSLGFVALQMGLKYTCPVRAHIGFKMLCSKTCNGCGVRSKGQDALINLTLNIVSDATVSQCLEEHLRQRDMDFRCKCGTDESSEICSFLTLPNVLIIQLIRFNYGLKGIKKVNSRVILSTELLVVPESGVTEQAKYSLVSIISHYGSTANCGHYICDGVSRFPDQNDDTDCWLTFDDKRVKETTAQTVCFKRQRSSYLLFYERQELREKRS